MLVPPPLSYVRSYSSKNTVTSLSALHPPSTPKAALLPAPALEKIMSSVQIWRALTSPYRLILWPSLSFLSSFSPRSSYFPLSQPLTPYSPACGPWWVSYGDCSPLLVHICWQFPSIQSSGIEPLDQSPNEPTCWASLAGGTPLVQMVPWSAQCPTRHPTGAQS